MQKKEKEKKKSWGGKRGAPRNLHAAVHAHARVAGIMPGVPQPSQAVGGQSPSEA